jgi:hypothetical protein
LAQADSIVTGGLAFTDFVPSAESTLPTGSFTYDKSTRQFLSFTVAWDGLTWAMNGLGQANYQALVGEGPYVQQYFMECAAGSNPVPLCDSTGAIFEMFLVNESTGFSTDALTDGFVTSGSRSQNVDWANGFITDPPLATPEPPTWMLILTGLTIVFILMLVWLLRPKRLPPPVIMTEFGSVTEKARLQAALNMRDDPEVKIRVEEAAIKQAGGDVDRGMAQVRYQFPEAYKK